MPAPKPIPRYVLYGDSPADVDLDFLHVETISERSRAHNWEIQPHRHADLVQLFMVATGGGEMRCDDDRRAFHAPTLILMPPATVHGFVFRPDTNGHVLTVSERFIAGVPGARADLPIAALLAEPRVLFVNADSAEAAGLPASFAAIAGEYVEHRPGRVASIGAHIGLILVAAHRLVAGDRERAPPTGDDTGEAAIFRRFRQQIERSFRQHRGVAEHAAELGVSDSRLTGLCRRIAGQSPLAVIHSRVMAEAKRELIYTSMTVAEIGYGLGFQDPAYFSRFFSGHAGESPAAYRRRQGRGKGGEAG